MIKWVFHKEKLKTIDTVYGKNHFIILNNLEFNTSLLCEIDLAEFERTGGIS